MDCDKYKIGIVGLGPVGMVLAAHLNEAGCEVAICDLEKEKMNLIRNKGIQLTGASNKTSYFKYVYTSVCELFEHGIDILICAVKSYKVDSILDQCTDYDKGLYVLSAQNGIDIGQKYTSKFDESHILRMVVNYAGNMQAPNVVNVTFFNPPNYIASINDTIDDVAAWMADILTGAELETKSENSFSLADQIWKKTILIASISPLCGISNLTVREAMTFPDTNIIIEQTILEAVDVAKAEGIKFKPNFVKLILRELKNAGDHFPSLAVDIINNRQTEIDFFNGKIVEYGRKHYIQTPLNLTFTNLVKAISDKNSEVPD